jgi:chemotaxis protein MotB
MRVTGLGPSVMYDADNPRNPMNRRISITVLNREAEESVARGAQIEASDAATADGALEDGGGLATHIEGRATPSESETRP